MYIDIGSLIECGGNWTRGVIIEFFETENRKEHQCALEERKDHPVF